MSLVPGQGHFGPDAIPGDARWRRGESVSLKTARDSMVSLELAQCVGTSNHNFNHHPRSRFSLRTPQARADGLLGALRSEGILATNNININTNNLFVVVGPLRPPPPPPPRWSVRCERRTPSCVRVWVCLCFFACVRHRVTRSRSKKSFWRRYKTTIQVAPTLKEAYTFQPSGEGR